MRAVTDGLVIFHNPNFSNQICLWCSHASLGMPFPVSQCAIKLYVYVSRFQRVAVRAFLGTLKKIGTKKNDAKKMEKIRLDIMNKVDISVSLFKFKKLLKLYLLSNDLRLGYKLQANINTTIVI